MVKKRNMYWKQKYKQGNYQRQGKFIYRQNKYKQMRRQKCVASIYGLLCIDRCMCRKVFIDKYLCTCIVKYGKE